MALTSRAVLDHSRPQKLSGDDGDAWQGGCWVNGLEVLADAGGILFLAQVPGPRFQVPGRMTRLWTGGCLPLPLSFTLYSGGLHHLFSLSTPIVSISLKLGFSRTFNFELIFDFKNIAKIGRRIPTYPSPSLPDCQHLTRRCVEIKARRSPWVQFSSPTLLT